MKDTVSELLLLGFASELEIVLELSGRSKKWLASCHPTLCVGGDGAGRRRFSAALIVVSTSSTNRAALLCQSCIALLLALAVASHSPHRHVALGVSASLLLLPLVACPFQRSQSCVMGRKHKAGNWR